MRADTRALRPGPCAVRATVVSAQPLHQNHPTTNVSKRPVFAIFAFSAHSSAELDLRVHDVGLVASLGVVLGHRPFAEGIGTKACLGRLAEQRLLLNCSAVLPECAGFLNLPTAHQTCTEDV